MEGDIINEIVFLTQNSFVVSFIKQANKETVYQPGGLVVTCSS